MVDGEARADSVSPSGRLARGQHTGQHQRAQASAGRSAQSAQAHAAPSALQPSPVLVSAPHGTSITATRAQPDPRLGAPGTHRRLDRPPARGHRPADPAFKREQGLEPDGEPEGAGAAVDYDDEIDLRAEDDALIAAELDAAEAERAEEDEDEERRGRRGEDAPVPSARPARRPRRHASQGGRRRSRRPSTTARRATACGSTPPSRTTRSTPSTGPATGPSRSRSRRTRS